MQALLYYQGVVTYADRKFYSLKLPNEMIRRAMLALFARPLRFWRIDELLRAPTAALLQDMLQGVVDIKVEKALATEASFGLRVASSLASLLHTHDVKVHVCFRDETRDVIVVRGNTALLIGCKRVGRDTIAIDDDADLMCMSEEELLQLGTNAQSQHMPAAGKSTLTRKVEHIVEAAQTQVRERESEIRKAGVDGITSETEVHAFAAVLVGNRIVVRKEN